MTTSVVDDSPVEIVHFYYGLGSRYSYLASTQLEALAAETGCEVEWCPVTSVSLMRLRGANPFEGRAMSGQYEWPYRKTDARRWAELYRVAYREPEDVRFEAETLVRAATAAKQLGRVESYSRSLFSAVFIEGVPEIDEEECVRRAVSLGLSRRQFESIFESESLSREVEATAQRAHTAGAFGVPSFVVAGELFWGNDRLVLLRHFLQNRLRRDGEREQLS